METPDTARSLHRDMIVTVLFKSKVGPRNGAAGEGFDTVCLVSARLCFRSVTVADPESNKGRNADAGSCDKRVGEVGCLPRLDIRSVTAGAIVADRGGSSGVASIMARADGICVRGLGRGRDGRDGL